MNQKYSKLFEKIKFPNGAGLDSRFAMSPMVVGGASYEGNVGEDDINYFNRRAESASMLITGATSVTEYGNSYGCGLGIYNDNQIDGWKKLSTTMKSKGAKAIVQLFHPGYRAAYTYKDKGFVLGPSDLEPAFLDYPITGMTKEQVEATIEEFVQATRRAIEAGFDGVEIHGANHYLIQQFFSKNTNFRTDEFGGSLENRARFALEIVKRVKRYVKENAKSDFIVGYRISPEEIHGKDVGYLFDDSIYLINQILGLGIDYFNVSLFGERAYAGTVAEGEYKGQSINKTIKNIVDGRAVIVGSGGIISPEKMLEATEYLDVIGMAALALVEPDAKSKIFNGKENEISLLLTQENYVDKAFPVKFPEIMEALKRSISLPKETIDIIDENKK